MKPGCFRWVIIARKGYDPGLKWRYVSEQRPQADYLQVV